MRSNYYQFYNQALLLHRQSIVLIVVCSQKKIFLSNKYVLLAHNSKYLQANCRLH